MIPISANPGLAGRILYMSAESRRESPNCQQQPPRGLFRSSLLSSLSLGLLTAGPCMPVRHTATASQHAATTPADGNLLHADRTYLQHGKHYRR